ncbi:AI-2E family transporter [Frigoribacterium salinisoli]
MKRLSRLRRALAPRPEGERPAGPPAGGPPAPVTPPPVVPPAPPSAPAGVLVDPSVPRGMVIAGAWSWRILVVVAVVAVFVWLVVQLRIIVIPFMVALLVSALLVPFSSWLQRHRWPKWLAVVVTLVGTITIVTGLVYAVVVQVRDGWPDLRDRSIDAYADLKQVLLDSPLHVTDAQLNGYLGDALRTLQQDSAPLLRGALSVGTTVGHVGAGLVLTLFATIFVLVGGRDIWGWFVRIFPQSARVPVDGAGRAGWTTLTNFVKVQIFVAAVDAIGIGAGAFFLGLPLVVPVTIGVFLGAFVPVVGAVVTGAVAVLIALVYNGWVVAVAMLAVVIIVQQLEGHFLQPFVMGSAVKVHPLAVVFGVAAGALLAGIPGALFAVPVLAVVHEVVDHLAGGRWRSEPGAPAPTTPAPPLVETAGAATDA